jgi:hypothetical protein
MKSDSSKDQELHADGGQYSDSRSQSNHHAQNFRQNPSVGKSPMLLDSKFDSRCLVSNGESFVMLSEIYLFSF